MNKKAQGLSVNVIIVAVLALLVLVVIAFIFTGRFAIFSRTTGDCEATGGDCEYSCDEGYSLDPIRKCYDGDEIDTTRVCCVPVT